MLLGEQFVLIGILKHNNCPFKQLAIEIIVIQKVSY